MKSSIGILLRSLSYAGYNGPERSFGPTASRGVFLSLWCYISVSFHNEDTLDVLVIFYYSCFSVVYI